MVSAGCAGCHAHSTAACVAGGNPTGTCASNLAGFPKDEVIIPLHSRNVYDAAVRSVGVRVIEVADVAPVPGRARPARRHGLRLSQARARRKVRCRTKPFTGWPGAQCAGDVWMPRRDALTIPTCTRRGATLVGYSGGKCIRGAAVRPGCCWAARTWCGPPGCKARRIRLLARHEGRQGRDDRHASPPWRPG